MDTYGWIAIGLGLIIYFFNRSKKNNGWRDLGMALFFGGIGWVSALIIAVTQISRMFR